MSSPVRSCPRCAATVAPDARFCPACGGPVARLFPGEVLDGKYEVLDKIGEGGMGEVWRVRHIHLDEIRIIKMTKPDPAGGGAAARRFQEEARLATLVRHPNVAALYDFSRQADGSYYMVWEYIDGVTLEAWLRRRGRLAPALALDVARQVLAGLSEIHAQGIVHRDLSPDNIMLRETPSGVRAKIIDLGIAKRVAAESLAMTGTGLFLGKLKYCSPEQAGALPSETPIDARSDIYSFGAVLYEMLSGKPLFESSTPEGYLGKHLHAPPPPLEVPDLPEASARTLSGIVARTLEKKRERRYSTARELSDALARVPTGPAEPSTAPTVSYGEPVARPARRGPPPAAVAAAIVVAAAALVWLWHGRRPPAVAVSAAPRATAAVPATAAPSPAPVEAVSPTAVPAPTVAASAPASPGPAPAPTAAVEQDRADLDETVRPL
ncbi:MAG: serine/threonine-protein kinase, partial [Syntrophomonadaceae bacterium]